MVRGLELEVKSRMILKGKSFYQNETRHPKHLLLFHSMVRALLQESILCIFVILHEQAPDPNNV
jgi:hypothetical protein